MTRTILVGYITRAGYTRRVATAIAQRLRDRGFEVDLADLELCIRRPAKYDAVILGCAVRFRRPATAMTKFVVRHREALATRPTAFFAVDGTKDAAAHVDTFLEETGWHPSLTCIVPGVRGARLRRAYAWLQDRVEAKSIKRVEAPTDWARIDAFAEDLAARVPPPENDGARRGSAGA